MPRLFFFSDKFEKQENMEIPGKQDFDHFFFFEYLLVT